MKTIRVTAEHIANGKRLSYCDCPIALAMFDCTGNRWFVSVGFLTRAVRSLVLTTPESARQFIADFDAGRPVQPFEFELPLEG